MEKCHPQLVEFYQAFHAALEKRAMPFVGFEFYREPERQEALKKSGVSNAGPMSSPHQWGMAVDVVHFERFWSLTKAEWAVIGLIGKEVARKRHIRVTWGGDFKSIYDPAHWELTDWRLYRDADKAYRILGGQKIIGADRYHQTLSALLETAAR